MWMAIGNQTRILSAHRAASITQNVESVTAMRLLA